MVGNKNDEQILEENGWEVHCQSPYEIYHPETNSSASNWGATAVVAEYKQDDKLYRYRLVVESYKEGIIDDKKFIEEIIKTENS